MCVSSTMYCTVHGLFPLPITIQTLILDKEKIYCSQFGLSICIDMSVNSIQLIDFYQLQPHKNYYYDVLLPKKKL